ncbi:MAG: Protein YzbB, partial [uncultured Gemmatimonadaceae bacterium]
RRRDSLPGDGLLRGDQRLRGARHGSPLRADRCALAQEPGGRRADERDAAPRYPLRGARRPGGRGGPQVPRRDDQGGALRRHGPRDVPPDPRVAAHDRRDPPAAPGRVPVAGCQPARADHAHHRAPRRHGQAPRGDRGRDTPTTVAGMGRGRRAVPRDPRAVPAVRRAGGAVAV